MFINDINLFAMNEKELETQVQPVRVYNKYVGMKVTEKNVPF